MDNMVDPILLEEVDRLFATGVGEHILLLNSWLSEISRAARVLFLKRSPAHYFLMTVVFALALQPRSPFELR